ncbi:MAG: hypothetical protein V3U75_04440 [Methylococcaceae bacterium]
MKKLIIPLALRRLFRWLAMVITFFFINACEPSPDPTKTVTLAPNGILSAALTHKMALLGSIDGRADLWLTNPARLLYTLAHSSNDEKGMIAVSLSDDSTYALTAERNTFAWWNTKDGILLNSWQLAGIQTAKLSRNGSHAIIGLPDQAVYFSLAHGKTVHAFQHQAAVTAVDISTTGKFVITGSSDKEAKLWSLNTGKLLHSWSHITKLSSVALSNNDQFAMLNAHLGPVFIRKTEDGTLYRKIGPKWVTVSAAQFSNDDKYLIAGRTNNRMDVWSLDDNKLAALYRLEETPNQQAAPPRVLAFYFNQTDQISTISTNGILQTWQFKPQ